MVNEKYQYRVLEYNTIVIFGSLIPVIFIFLAIIFLNKKA